MTTHQLLITTPPFASLGLSIENDDKMTKEQIKKVGHFYLINGACLMLLATVDIYFSYLHPFDFRETNTFIRNNSLLFFFFAFSIIISFINTPVFAITGLVFLFKRRRVGLALFLWTSTALFFIVGR